MAEQNLQMQIDARRNNNESSTKYGRIYPALYLKGCLSTGGLIKHMSEHGSLVTDEVLKLVLAQLKKCIPELCSQGHSVELEGLGIFYPSIKCAPNAGKSDVETFIATPTEDMIAGVHLRFKPIGDDIQKLTSKYFKQQCSFVKGDYVKVNMVEDPQTHKRTTWIERIPLEDWETYKANGGSAVPTRPTD
jgi:nucleoid DNA-binding protein